MLSGSHDPSPQVSYLAVTERAQSFFIELNSFLVFSLTQVTLRQRLTHLHLSQVILCAQVRSTGGTPDLCKDKGTNVMC